MQLPQRRDAGEGKRVCSEGPDEKRRWRVQPQAQCRAGGRAVQLPLIPAARAPGKDLPAQVCAGAMGPWASLSGSLVAQPVLETMLSHSQLHALSSKLRCSVPQERELRHECTLV